MRIAMIGAKGLPTLYPVGGGIETHVENLSRHLCDRGHEVTVYVRKYANPKQKKKHKGIKIVTLPSLKTKHLDTITHVLLASLHALTMDYDIWHYHGIGPSTLCWIPRVFKRSTRVISTFHSRDQFHEKWGGFAKLYLMFAEWATVAIPHATITVSHELQILCSLLFPKKEVDYVPNGVEIPKKISGVKELKQFHLKKGKYFIHLARIVAHKAQDDSIRAFKQLKTTDKLVIAGSASFDDVDYLEDLKILAKDDPRIIFTGHISGPTLRSLVGNCRAMVHPSRSEGLSVSILEAMSNGKVVIMSDIPANLELIDHSGIAIPVGDIEMLSAAMQWVIDDPETANMRGARGKEIIKRLFSWESVARHIEYVYEGTYYERKGLARYRQVEARNR
ncbi:MAG: glycosyltransferase family 4 protein [Patescibacteria group bacterium]|nr:glycosyltransferase family 4 protein [Patescibacteria group bacterium]